MSGAGSGAAPAALARAIPHYFGPAERRRFGWRHDPAPGVAPRSSTIVICAPIGYEAISTHRTLRHLAERLAALGFTVLRFDYDGTGDSAGDHRDPARWESWVASTGDAIDAMRVTTGARDVRLIGFRLGATIAAAAARVRAEVGGLALIAPVVSGRLFLREAKALVGAMGRPAAPAGLAHPEGYLESAGMILDPASQQALAAFGIADGAVPRELLVVDRDDRAPQQALVEALSSRGAHVEHEVLPGYVEMTLDPHDAVVPGRILERIERWLSTAPTRDAPAAPRDATAAVTLARVAEGVEESLEFLDADSRRFGIVSRPVGAVPRRAMLLLNSGAIHRVANARLYVALARRLAAQGWLVLRYDLSGIGDSRPHPGAEENDVYSRHAVADLENAIAHVRQRHGATHVEAMGLCSGAYTAFKGAAAGLALNGVFVINPLVFFWKVGMSLAYPPFEMINAGAQYAASARDPRKWLKVLRGEVDVVAAARVLAHRASAHATAVARGAARAARIPIRDDLAGELEAIRVRKIALHFIFSVGDPGEVLLAEGAGRSVDRLLASGAMSLDHLELCDHSLSVTWMHERLWHAVSAHLAP